MNARLIPFLLCVVFIVGESAAQKGDRKKNPSGEATLHEDASGFPALLNDAKKDAIKECWDLGEPGEFTSRHPSADAAVKIKYRIFERADEKAAIVISSGRTECMFKYEETIYDLYEEGYSVYIHDHRGQGFSGPTIGTEKDPRWTLPSGDL